LHRYGNDRGKIPPTGKALSPVCVPPGLKPFPDTVGRKVISPGVAAHRKCGHALNERKGQPDDQHDGRA
jgi:hypothetical protein